MSRSLMLNVTRQHDLLHAASAIQRTQITEKKNFAQLRGALQFTRILLHRLLAGATFRAVGGTIQVVPRYGDTRRKNAQGGGMLFY